MPLLFHWRWYYHFPSLPLWALILVLLIVPKSNRDRRAWLILIPLVVVLLVWRMPPRLFAMADGTTETLGFYIVSCTMAWSVIWLLGDWLGGRHRKVTLFLGLGIMLAVGLLSYYGHYGAIEQFASLGFLIPYGIFAFILLAAMVHTGYLCRHKYSRGRFLGWLAVWNCIAALGLMLVYDIFMLVMIGQFPWFVLAGLAFMTAFASVFIGGILYLVNLPFLILAFKSPFYGDRFKRIFHIEKDRIGFNMSSERQVV